MSDVDGSAHELDADALEVAHRMFELARAGQRELVELVAAGQPANLTDARGNTLLMLASYHGHRELVAGLLAHGADPNRMNDRGQTPLSAAAFRGDQAACEALLAAGADPEAGAPSAVETARLFDHSELADLLADAAP